jgi:hypothetical protein
MTTGDAVAAMAARLRAIDWEGHDLHTLSRVRLLREYLRRAAQWAEAFGCTDQWPCFDIAACVDPTVRADTDTARELREHLVSARAGWYAKQIGVWALHWAALKSSAADHLPNMEDPFEPIIVMYERGGDFYSEQGFLQVDARSLRRKSWQEHLSSSPIASLDGKVLDEMDAEDPHAIRG